MSSDRRKAAKKASAVDSTAFYEEQEVSDQIAAYELRLAALKAIYLTDMEAAARKKSEQMELEAQVAARKRELEERTEERLDVLTDYTRQHKADEREMIAELSLLDARHNQLMEDKAKLQQDIEEREAEYDAKIKAAKAKFDALNEKSDAMEKEFTKMLADVERSARAL